MFEEKIKSFTGRIEELKNNVQTEEATKTSLIMPFFSLLGLKSDKIILRPENPIYDDIIYEKDDMNRVHILGKAVAFQSSVR